VTLYDATLWHELFVASAGAAAALAGLVFVAVSINVERIPAMHGVPERALQTILLLVAVVVISIVGLVPQSTQLLAIEVLVLAVLLCFAIGVPTRGAFATSATGCGWPPEPLPSCPAAWSTSSVASACSRRAAVGWRGSSWASSAGLSGCGQHVGPPRRDPALARD
jgi:hypothetical protein